MWFRSFSGFGALVLLVEINMSSCSQLTSEEIMFEAGSMFIVLVGGLEHFVSVHTFEIIIPTD